MPQSHSKIRGVKNPWKDFRDLTSDMARGTELMKFLEAILQDGKSVREACTDVFHSANANRKLVVDMFQAAHRVGFLTIQPYPVPQLRRRLMERFELEALEVVNVDTADEYGKYRFGRVAARFLIERLNRHIGEGTGRKLVGLAAGNGQTVGLLAKGLKSFDDERNRAELENAEYGNNPLAQWSKIHGRRLAVHTPTIGDHPDHIELSALEHLVDIARILRVPGAQRHLVSSSLPLPTSVDKRKELQKTEEIQNALRKIKQNVRVVVFSPGAGKDNPCMNMMNKHSKGSPGAVGEILYNLYDENGEVIHADRNPTLSLLPDGFLPQRLRESRAKAGEFDSIALAAHFAPKKESTQAKAKAVWAAIRNPRSRWCNALVCTADIAKEILQIDDRDGASKQPPRR